MKLINEKAELLQYKSLVFLLDLFNIQEYYASFLMSRPLSGPKSQLFSVNSNPVRLIHESEGQLIDLLRLLQLSRQSEVGVQ